MIKMLTHGLRIFSTRRRQRGQEAIDTLTRMPTLPSVTEEGEKWLRSGRRLGIVRIDINHFKAINDTYGYPAGDRLLVQMGSLLLREADKVDGKAARVGGDEFVLLVPDWVASGGKEWVDRMKQLFSQHMFTIDEELPPVIFDFSIGYCCRSEQPGQTIEEMLREADKVRWINKYTYDGHWNYNELKDIQLSPRAEQLLQVMYEKDVYTYIHSRHVAKFSQWLGEELMLEDNLLKLLQQAGWLHDVGKILVPNQLLLKKGKLTEEEYAIIQRHVMDGLNMIADDAKEEELRQAILCHHERWDGTGYPRGVRGEDTPLSGRILQITDAFSAMTIKRVYQSRKNTESALEELRRLQGQQFDSCLVEQFANAVNRRIGKGQA